MLSRLSTRSLRSLVTYLQQPHSYQVVGSGEIPVDQSLQYDAVKCTSKTPSIFRFSESSIDNHDDSSRAEASGDESDGEDYDSHRSDGLADRTKEQYVLKEARKKLGTEGAAPSSASALDSLEHHLRSRSNVKSSLAPLSISLFNFHSTQFAQRLLDRSVGNLVLVESALEYSLNAKDFARSERRKGRRVEAVHADPAALFGLDRRKKEEKGKGWKRKKKVPLFSFPDQLVARPSADSEEGVMMPLRLRRGDSRPPTTVVSPIIVCPLALKTQQVAVLDAMLRILLRHHLGIDEKGLYSLGDVELLTYLHSEQMAYLLSSTSPNLSFLSHATRRRSQLMNKLFLIREFGKPLSAASFSPPNFPPTKKMAHEKKMKEFRFSSSRWFGASLQPRSTVVIAGKEVVPGQEANEDDRLPDLSSVLTLPPSVLAPYAYWCEALGKTPATKKTADVINILIPGTTRAAQSIIPSAAKIGEVTAEDLDAVFIEALPELRECANFKQFEAKTLTKSDGKHDFAD